MPKTITQIQKQRSKLRKNSHDYVDTLTVIFSSIDLYLDLAILRNPSTYVYHLDVNVCTDVKLTADLTEKSIIPYIEKKYLEAGWQMCNISPCYNGYYGNERLGVLRITLQMNEYYAF